MYNLYTLTSNLDDKIYIGITNNPSRRYYEHMNYTVEKSHYNGNWIRKILKNNGEIKMTLILSNLSKKTAISLEIKMIELLKKIAPDICTNTAQGGLGFNHKGIPHSEEHKRNLEKAQPHKVRIPREDLYDLYVNKGLSKHDIGKIYHCGATTIDRRLIEYKIPIRCTKNYKVSYTLNKEQIIDMFLNKKMTIKKISESFNIGPNVIRTLLKRNEIETNLNSHRKKYDELKLKQRYNELIKENIRKMEIYEILSKEFNISKRYISKMNLK